MLLALAGGLIHSTADALAQEGRKAVLPLGDGNISFKPVKGHIFVCDTNFMAGGAFRDGPWIRDGQWFPDGKIWVEGNVGWPQARLLAKR
ncbi:MAG: hypothetical protein K2Q01_10685, partial [Rickettsiales bacterium]|nr:hypothetical protein [Rickettsiales bacterium]